MKQFNEQKLREEIAKTWGEHGAHIEVFDMLLKRASQQEDVSGSLPFFFTRKTMIDFCEWSKEAEWRDGEHKGAFIKNDWENYIKLYLKDKLHKQCH